jgi:ribosomal protein S27E
MSNLKCPDCGEEIVLRDKLISRTNARCKLRIEESKATGKLIVIRGQETQESQPTFKHYYSVVCDKCEQGILSSESYKDVTDYLIKYF